MPGVFRLDDVVVLSTYFANGPHLVVARSVMPHKVTPADSNAVFVSSLVTGLVKIPVGVIKYLAVSPKPRVFGGQFVKPNPELLVSGIWESTV